MKPNVLVAGFSRCASTYFCELLKQHPNIFIPKRREVHWFHKTPLLLSEPELENWRYYLSKKHYLNKFKTDKKIVVDGSVMSAYDINSSIKVYEELGDIKIIFLIRDKESHKKSIKKMFKGWREKTEGLEIYSNFEMYMNFYKSIFSKILIIKMEDLTDNPNKIMKKVFGFLNVAKNITLDINVEKNEVVKISKFKRKLLVFYSKFRRNI